MVFYAYAVCFVVGIQSFIEFRLTTKFYAVSSVRGTLPPCVGHIYLVRLNFLLDALKYLANYFIPLQYHTMVYHRVRQLTFHMFCLHDG